MAPLKIEKTKNYSQFKVVFGNRIVSRKHVQRIKESIMHKNLLQYQPIMVNPQKLVIDGQHRLQAAKELMIDIYFIVVPQTDINDVRFLNSNLKAWSSHDFAKSYAESGNENYKILLKKCEETELPLLITAALLMNRETIGYQAMTEFLKDGEFKIGDEKQANEAFKKIERMRPFVDGNAWKTTDFIKALFLFLKKGASYEEILKKLQTHGRRIRKQGDMREYIYQFLEIYNIGKSAGMLMASK